jgi:hypothetical protein
MGLGADIRLFFFHTLSIEHDNMSYLFLSESFSSPKAYLLVFSPVGEDVFPYRGKDVPL